MTPVRFFKSYAGRVAEFKGWAGSDDYAFEAYERMTDGGCTVEINEHPEPVNPWGIFRFREPTPPGGLRLRSWAD
jgi:hypothetical protein